MSSRAMVAIGFVSMVIATGVVGVSWSVASDTNEVDVVKSAWASNERIGQGGSTYQSNAVRTGDCTSSGEAEGTADVVKRIGHGGSHYQGKSAHTGPCNFAGEAGGQVDVVEHIGQGESQYSNGQMKHD